MMIFAITIGALLALVCSPAPGNSNCVSKEMLITPDNVRHYATSFHSSGTVFDRLIHFSRGTNGENLLNIPLGIIESHSIIQVTVALKPRSSTIDSDPYVGLSDGSNSNVFILRDPTNFSGYSPCQPYPATQDDTRIPSNSVQASVYQLQFDPFHQYGACSAAYGAGYVNTGRFNGKLDLKKPISFVVNREDSPEEYSFLYFKIKIF